MIIEICTLYRGKRLTQDEQVERPRKVICELNFEGQRSVLGRCGQQTFLAEGTTWIKT